MGSTSAQLGLIRVANDYERNTTSVVSSAADIGDGLKSLKASAQEFLRLLSASHSEKLPISTPASVSTVPAALKRKAFYELVSYLRS